MILEVSVQGKLIGFMVDLCRNFARKKRLVQVKNCISKKDWHD